MQFINHGRNPIFIPKRRPKKAATKKRRKRNKKGFISLTAPIPMYPCGMEHCAINRKTGAVYV